MVTVGGGVVDIDTKISEDNVHVAVNIERGKRKNMVLREGRS